MIWPNDCAGTTTKSSALSALTTLGVGGPAAIAVPETLDDVAALLASCWQSGRAWRALGRGSNLIVADEGVPGIVVHTAALRSLRFDDRAELEGTGRVVAGAGLPTSVLLAETRKRGLGGLECLVGYPATVGGAARMNAGGKWGTIATRVESVRVVAPDGAVRELTAEECAFAYRSTSLAGSLVAEVVLRLPRVEAGAYRAAIERIHTEKAATQPLSERSAGCIFKNPTNESAGRLVDLAGVKGATRGGAAISDVHGNFVVNRGGATATDVLRLIDHARDAVSHRMGIDLELEVEIWGRGRVPAAV